MSSQGFEVWASSADGRETEEIRKEGAVHFPIPFTRKVTPFQDLICLVRLIRLIRRIRPHIVHTHTPKAGLLGMFAALVCRVPVRMHTVAGLPSMAASGWKRGLLNLTEFITYACAHRVYPNSTGLRTFIDTHFPSASSKLKIIGKGSSNGIDIAYFSPSATLQQEAKDLRDKLKIPGAAVVFSFLGRLVRDKGLVELVTAFVTLPGENSWLLLIGPEEPDLDPLPAGTLNMIRTHPRIVLAGFQKEVRAWLLASDVFVFPSYREGFPNAVMQASCLERPCIVSDINGCNEIIEDGKTGCIVPPKNTLLLQSAMATLMVDSDLRRRFGSASRQFVATNFSHSFVWNELLQEYKSMLIQRES